jgi:magnesium transporter
MLRIFSLESGRMVCSSNGGIPHGHDSLPNTLWYELHEPTDEERAFVNGKAHVDVPTREDIEEIEVSSRLYHEDGAEYMTITALTKFEDSEAHLKTPVMFILKNDTLVTVRYAGIRPFENVVDRAARSVAVGTNGEQIMLSLIEALVDRLADMLEHVGDKVDTISRGVFRTKPGANDADRDLQGAIEQVGRQGDLLGVARESLVSFNRMIGYHQGTGHITRSSAESEWRAGTIQRDVTALSDHATYLGSKISFLLDATLGLINLEQNQIIKLFSIAAVCLMPPTLVASVYGMNFKLIPELEWAFGYPMALILMLITGVAPYLYFKRRGWL